MKKEQPPYEAVVEPDERPTDENSRRDFLRQGGIGLAGLAGAAALGLHSSEVNAQEHHPSEVNAEEHPSGKRRVVILADSNTHMMPALALEMARRNHDFVLGDAKAGLADELRGMGAKVEVVPDTADQTKDDTIQKLVDRAIKVYGSFDSACIRTGTHGTGTIMDTTNEDCRLQYEGNFRSVWYALKALMPPLMKQGSGQIVINTSAAGARVQSWFALYGATRAGANELVHAAGLEAAPHGVTVNATGTYAMNYESFIHDVGGDTDPAKLQAVKDQLPIRRLVEPEDAAYFVAGLIDGKNTAMTAQFFPIDGGWSFM
jgi:NAD(P)-dependent dehydrogenase (short-subunit alcohol dehydrogenase family)